MLASVSSYSYKSLWHIELNLLSKLNTTDLICTYCQRYLGSVCEYVLTRRVY